MQRHTRATKKIPDELADCRVTLIRMVGRLESLVGQARASAATLPILKALGEVEAMRLWAERQERVGSSSEATQ